MVANKLYLSITAGWRFLLITTAFAGWLFPTALKHHVLSEKQEGSAAVSPQIDGKKIDSGTQPNTSTWIETGSLATGRKNHTSILLPDGKVLVVGGESSVILASAEIFDPFTGRWQPTGSLHVGRRNHTATLLPNGWVLVVGGVGVSGILTSAELFNPVLGTWMLTDSLTTARSWHTASLLLTGKVLVAGGLLDGNISTTDSDIFDLETSKWAPTGSLTIARCRHTATLLPSGKVLVTGGSGNEGTLASAEIYDPSGNGGLGSWIETSNMVSPRSEHTATLLPNWKVLVVGGVNDSNYLAEAEIFDPSDNGGLGSWTPTGSMSQNRAYHTATLLPDGRVLIIGGTGDSPIGPRSSSEIYDSSANDSAGSWNSTSSLNNARVWHTAVLLHDSRVLVTGGYMEDALADTEIYDARVWSWRATEDMNVVRSGHVATLLLDGKVLVVGGTDSCPVSAEVFDPVGNGGIGSWSFTANMSTCFFPSSATVLPNGKVLVTGSGKAEVYDPVNETWTATGDMTRGLSGRPTVLLPDGKVLAVGGTTDPGDLNSAEVYDPAGNHGIGSWTMTGHMNMPRAGPSATLLSDGQVLAVGGRLHVKDSVALAELYDPVTGTWTETGSLNTGRAGHTAALLQNGRVLVVGGSWFGDNHLDCTEIYDPILGVWTDTGKMNAGRQYHKATLLLDGRVLVIGGETYYSDIPYPEVYDPTTGMWTALEGSMSRFRLRHSVTLLTDGRVLVAGGYTQHPDLELKSAEIYDPGQGFDEAWRPILSNTSDSSPVGTVLEPVALGSPLNLNGSGFRGYGNIESSGGTTNSPASNYPIVQLRRLDNGQVRWLSAKPSQPFSATSFTSKPLTAVNPGPTLLTVFVNGIPSRSKGIVILGYPLFLPTIRK